MSALPAAAPHASSILNVLPARIVSKSVLGQGEVIVVLALGADGRGAELLARITLRSWDLLGLAEQMPVFAQVKGVSLVSGAAGARPEGDPPVPTTSPGSPRRRCGTALAGTNRRKIIVEPSTRGAMTSDFQDINPNHLAAILYRPEDDVDALLADFAALCCATANASAASCSEISRMKPAGRTACTSSIFDRARDLDLPAARQRRHRVQARSGRPGRSLDRRLARHRRGCCPRHRQQVLQAGSGRARPAQRACRSDHRRPGRC